VRPVTLKQNGTIERKQPCLLERGSRNYLLHLVLYFVSFLLSARCTLFFPLRIHSILHSSSLSLSFSRLSSPFFRRHDRVSVPAMLRVQEFRTGKKDWEHGLPLDPNSSTSPRYFRSPVLVLLLPTKSLPCFFQLQVGTPIISRRMKFADNTRRGYTDVYFSEIPNFVISYDILPDYSSVSQLQDLLPRLRATCRGNSMGSGNDIGICGISGEDTRSYTKRIKTVLARMESAYSH